MVRILRRQRPWHVGHTPASNKDLLSLEPAVLASVSASNKYKDVEMAMVSSQSLCFFNKDY